MNRTQRSTREQARSRGTERGAVLIVTMIGIIGVTAFAGSQLVHLLGGIRHALP